MLLQLVFTCLLTLLSYLPPISSPACSSQLYSIVCVSQDLHECVSIVQDSEVCAPFPLSTSSCQNKGTPIIILIIIMCLVIELITHLHQLPTDRILDFLTGRSQVVRMGNNTSSPLVLNTAQGCILCPLLYSLYTHDCTATHSSNVIIKFADDTTVIGLITDNDETAYREEVSTLIKWCQENHISLNIDKTKKLVVDFRRQSREHTPITIDKTPVERVNSFKFLGIHITEDLTWSAHTDAVLKKAHQRLFFLRRLRKFGTSPRILRSFYTCTVESILTGCITAWFGNHTAGNRKALKKGRANCPPHCWRWASLPPGHQHQAVYKESQEVHQGLQPPVPQSALSAALRKTSPQHSFPH